MSAPSYDLFKSVFYKSIECLIPLLKEELEKEVKSEIFQNFPRKIQHYSEILRQLEKVAKMDERSTFFFCLASLKPIFKNSEATGKIFYKEFFGTEECDKLHSYAVCLFLAIIFSDLIYTLVINYEITSKTIKKLLVDCGFLSIFGSFTFGREYILPQWSVILSVFSVSDFEFIWRTLEATVFNQYIYLFQLLRYVKLDHKNNLCVYFVDYLLDITSTADKRKKIADPEIFNSLSTCLVSIDKDCSKELKDILKKFECIALKYINNDVLGYSAVYLLSSIKPIICDDKEVEKFYVEYVRPKINKSSQGFKLAVQCLSQLIFSRSIEHRYWSPFPSNKKQKDPNQKFLEMFINDEYFKSEHFDSCDDTITDILVAIAESRVEDFNIKFIKGVTNQYHNIKKSDQERICSILSCLSCLSFESHQKYLSSVANIIYPIFEDSAKFKEIGVLTNYSSLSTNVVHDVCVNWSIDHGPKTEIAYQGAKIDSFISMLLKNIEQIPLLLTYGKKGIDDWVRILVKLSTCGDNAIENSSITIIEYFLDKSEYYKQICNCLVSMIKYDESVPVIFVSLKLLHYAAVGQEPMDDEDFKVLCDNIEFSSFLGLASSIPSIRIISYKLLIEVNRLLRNLGLYHHIDIIKSTIESDVKTIILSSVFSKRPGVKEFREKDLYIHDALASEYQKLWFYFLAEISRIAVRERLSTKNINEIISVFKSKNRNGCNVTNHFTTGFLVILSSISYCSEYTIVGIDNKSLGKKFKESIMEILTGDTFSKDEEFNGSLLQSLVFLDGTVVPKVLSRLNELTKFTPTQKIKLTSDLIRRLKGFDYKLNKSGNEFEENPKEQSLSDLCFVNLVDILNPAKELIYKEVEGLKKDKSPDNKCHIGKFIEKIKEDVLFSYLTILGSFTTFEPVSLGKKVQAENFVILCDLLYILEDQFYHDNEFDKSLTLKIKFYISNSIQVLIKFGGSFGKPIEWFPEHIFSTLLWPEEHRYHVFKRLLSNNFSTFIKKYIDESFKRDSKLSDPFFDSIYNYLCKSKIDYIFDNKCFEQLLLLVIYKEKTGFANASLFLKFICNDISDSEPEIKDVIRIYSREIESFVYYAINCVLDGDIACSIKVMVDILEPWIRSFRLLPNSDTCVPTIRNINNKMTPGGFLELLTRLTNKYMVTNRNDFEYVCKLWKVLFESKDNIEIVPYYIINCHEEELKVAILLDILEEYPSEILEIVTKRCRFSFYAFIRYEKDLDFEKEQWFVDIIKKIIKKNGMKVKEHIPVILHFSLLFHSTQTQSLLKRICKLFKVEIPRRALSHNGIKDLVKHFLSKLRGSDELILEWADEASRWAMGSNNIRIALTSLTILNVILREIKYKDPVPLFVGMANSVRFFLTDIESQISQGETSDKQIHESLNKSNQEFQQLVFRYINESFSVFDCHFENNEESTLSYLKVFFDLVISFDLYMDGMFPLYSKCRSSEKTKASAEGYLLSAIRPTFNELESDETILKTFNSINCPSDSDFKYDFDFVNLVITKHIYDFEAKVDKFLNDENNIELIHLNRALAHYSFMLLTASTDLQKRIFIVSRKIVEYWLIDRIRKNPKFKRSPSNLNILTDTFETLLADVKKERKDFISQDIDKYALVSIYNYAAGKLRSMDEAVLFIIELFKLDPLITNYQVSVLTESIRLESLRTTIKELKNLSKSPNESSSLTDCEDLNSIPCLLYKDIEPQILPFTTEYAQINYIKSKCHELKETLTVPEKPTFDNEINQNKLESINEAYEVISCNIELLDNNYLMSPCFQGHQQPTLSLAEFLSLQVSGPVKYQLDI